jgi:hypothetical protein
MVSKLLLVIIFSFLYVHLNPHGSFDVQKGPIKIFFLLFECKIKLYMLGYVS